MINCPISVGELIDKITILEIKKNLIFTGDAQFYIDKELTILLELLSSINISKESLQKLDELHNELTTTNKLIWDNEDEKRRLDELNCFDEYFIEVNKISYRLNDQRALIKMRINSLTKSEICEFKNHKFNS